MPEPATIRVTVNGASVAIPAGATASTALLIAGVAARLSVSGEPRTALCGMGICFECRALIDGVPHQRTCQLPARDGMALETQP